MTNCMTVLLLVRVVALDDNSRLSGSRGIIAELQIILDVHKYTE